MRRVRVVQLGGRVLGIEMARGFVEGSLLPGSGLHWYYLFRSVLDEWGGGAWVLCSLGVSRRKLTSPSSKKFSVFFTDACKSVARRRRRVVYGSGQSRVPLLLL